MKSSYLIPFAVTLVSAARTRARFDPAEYEQDFFAYREPIQSGEVFYADEDPYAVQGGQPRQAPKAPRDPAPRDPAPRDPREHRVHVADYGDGHFEGDGHDHSSHHEGDGHDHGNHYEGDGHDHRYVEPQPVRQEPTRVQEPPRVQEPYRQPEPVYHDHAAHQETQYVQNNYPEEYYGNVPNGGFWNSVDDFNAWNEIWDQADYESRINTEAELMVSLEAVRELLVDLDYELDHLEDCINDNVDDIYENHENIDHNISDIEQNDIEIDDQAYRVKRLQKQCRYCQDRLEEDRDALVLYCMQYSYAHEMIGCCADILTCNATELSYRWDFWTGHHAAPTQYVQQPVQAVPQGDFHGHGDYAHGHGYKDAEHSH